MNDDMCPGCGGPLDDEGNCAGVTETGLMGVEEFDQAHAHALDVLRDAKSFILFTVDDEGEFEAIQITDRRDLRVEMMFMNRANMELERYSQTRLNSGDYGFGYYPLYTAEEAEQMREEAEEEDDDG